MAIVYCVGKEPPAPHQLVAGKLTAGGRCTGADFSNGPNASLFWMTPKVILFTVLYSTLSVYLVQTEMDGQGDTSTVFHPTCFQYSRFLRILY